MASKGMAETKNWLALANGIQRDDRDKWMISFGYASEGMTGTNNWLASANGSEGMTGTNEWLALANCIRRDDWDK
jgi:hypothetical protein